MQAVFPIWKRASTKAILEEFLDLDFKAILICVSEKYLDSSFAGRIINQDF